MVYDDFEEVSTVTRAALKISFIIYFSLSLSLSIIYLPQFDVTPIKRVKGRKAWWK